MFINDREWLQQFYRLRLGVEGILPEKHKA